MFSVTVNFRLNCFKHLFLQEKSNFFNNIIVNAVTNVNMQNVLQTENDRVNEEETLNFETNNEEDVIPPPPNGGYGWVIVFASFMCNLIVDGIGYSFGVFLPQLVIYFEVGKGTIALVGSILAGSILAVGEFIFFL